MTAVDSSLVTDAVVTLLRSQLPVPVGDGAAPDPGGDPVLAAEIGWVVVQQTAAGASAHVGSIYTQAEEMERVRFLVTATGAQRNQVERLANAAMSVLIDRDGTGGPWTFPITVPGHVVIHRRLFGRVPTSSLGSWQAGGYVELLVNVA